MEDTIQKRWVGGICIKDGAVLLIHRINKEKLFHQEYFIFPGKSVEEDESLESALIAYFESISMKVTLGDLLYSKEEVSEDEESEYYYYCAYQSGEPQLLLTEEEVAESNETQQYKPLWVALKDIDELIVYPESIKAILEEQLAEGGISSLSK